MQVLRYAVGDWQEVAAVSRFIDAYRRTGSATVNRFIYPGSPTQIIPVAVFLKPSPIFYTIYWRQRKFPLPFFLYYAAGNAGKEFTV